MTAGQQADPPVTDVGNSTGLPPMAAITRAAKTWTVLVCDDQQPVRDAIAKVLAGAAHFVVVGEATDGPGCLTSIKQLRPDILILDYSMPGGGPHIASAAREINPSMYILVFSGRDDARVRREMISAGANQYILKTGRLRPLLEALQAAHAGV
jgi:DNA-binding NarL/FixJ family response regulator